jgi:diguanylate cyclase (GGDEF)-like protein
VWIRDVVHVNRNARGEVTSLVGFMFDISERKRAEEELLRLHRELEAMSLTDVLTGLANRRKFDQRLETEWSEARRTGRPLSLVLVDVDWFKPFNDTHGHIAGDDCLQSIAGVLRNAARRPRDVAARLGGDEFVVLLPDTDEAAAQALAREIADGIAALRIPHGAGGAHDIVSASIGVGTRFESDSGDARVFMQSVDKGLYAAKRRGRDRVATAGYAG